MSEDAWLQRVLNTATVHGWLATHFRPAQTAKGWRTPLQGYPGVPDLILARHGRVILAELKSDTGQPTPEQRHWLTELGDHGRLWRPGDWDTVLAELSKRERRRG